MRLDACCGARHAGGGSLSTIRVLIGDDHAETRADVRKALAGDPAFEICAEVGDAAAAVDAAMRESPDICLLDVLMPGGGIPTAREVMARRPGTKVVMLTVSTDDRNLFAALRAGASGYLIKDMDPDRLAPALKDVVDGKAAIPRDLVARVFEEFRDRGPRRRQVELADTEAELTSREWQVLDLLRRGNSTAQIARRLYISPATVRSHVSSVLRKLGVPDRKSALQLFRRNGGPS